MSWEADIEELRRREALARQMGGPDKVKRQHDAGRLTVRERIEALLDPGSFHEIGALAGRAQYGDDGEIETFQPANFVFGRGRIDGRPVVVGGDDFTVRGGAADAAIRAEAGDVGADGERAAPADRAPGRRHRRRRLGQDDRDRRATPTCRPIPAGTGWSPIMGTVPVVALGLGSVAGLGAARLVTSHYSLMVEGISHMFIAGPPVVARARRDRSPRTSSAAATSMRAHGAVDDVVASEAEAFARARRFLSYLPSSVYELPRAHRARPTIRRGASRC